MAMSENKPSKKEQELQKKIIELNFLDSQTKDIEDKMGEVVKQINEIQQLKLALNKLEDFKEDNEMFSPLGPNTFVKTKLQDNSKVLMNVGKNVFVNKTIPDALRVVDKNIGEASEVREALLKEMEKVTTRMMELQKEVEEINS